MLFPIVILLILILTAVLVLTKDGKEASSSMASQPVSKRGETADGHVAAIFRICREMITSDKSEERFLARYADYLMKILNLDGAAVMSVSDGAFQGISISGSCPPLLSVSPDVEKEFSRNGRKHSEFFKKQILDFAPEDVYLGTDASTPALIEDPTKTRLPEGFKNSVSTLIYIPVPMQFQTLAAILIVANKNGNRELTRDDCDFIAQLSEFASIAFETIRVTRQRREHVERLRAAKEEGMLQVSTGVIHNIGNAVTVAKLSVRELEDILTRTEERPESMILQEILPIIKKKVESGDIQHFLSEDPAGSQYLDVMNELLLHIQKSIETSDHSIKSLSSKLYHISGIIELQQRFVGELGTESMTSLAEVMTSAIKIFEETCNKRDVKIITDLEGETPKVLVDPSMMTQVFMNLIKNAVEAMDADPDGVDKKRFIKLSIEIRRENGNQFVVGSVKDNGPGIPREIKTRIFNFGFSTKGKKKSRGFGLHSCKDTVIKYGGKIEVNSKPGDGTSFDVYLPVK